MKLIPTRRFPLVPLLMSLFVSLSVASPVFADPTPSLPAGSGTSGDPYQISSLEELYWIAATDTQVPTPPRSTRWSAYYKQTADITLTGCSTWDSGAGWTPIGIDATTSFTGSYDGQGHTITGLRITRTTSDNQGLFGHVGTGDGTETNIVIKNLGLEDVQVAASRGVGSLIGRVTGNHFTRIGKCYSTNGWVKGDGATGGLIGSHNSYVETPGGTANPMLSYSWSDLAVSFSGSTSLVLDEPDKFGGLVGCSQKGTISDCYARGNVTVNATEGDPGQRVGGLAGCNIYRGEMYRSYSTGLVTMTNCTYVGGLLGRITVGGAGNNGYVEASFWDTTTSGQGSSAGGTGKATADMQKVATFTTDLPLAERWDFTDVWAIQEDTTYPYFQDKPLLVELASFTATPSQNGILLEWETASEINHAGFHIWRSGSAEGTYTQITDALIPAEGGPSMGAAYAYEDTNMLRKVYTRHDRNRNRIYVFQDLAGGRAYYYRLEAIDNAGVSEFFGPVSASVQNPSPAPKGWGKIVQP